MCKPVVLGYDVDFPFDEEIALDVPYGMLNKKGRKLKRKRAIRSVGEFFQ